MSSIRNDPARWISMLWSALAASLVLLLAPCARAQGQPVPTTAATVRVFSDAGGSKLQVDGRDFMVYGVNWDYTPIGQNYMYNLWNEPDAVIEAALAREMPLLQGMGVNALRQYSGIPPRWVRYIYERYGIYTVLNHAVARYGYTVDGTWIPAVDYSNPRLREVVKADVLAQVDQYRGCPGVLMWLLGNENNYGLSWSSFEIEALPKGERDAARAKYLYSLFGEIIQGIKVHEPGRVVAIANGDVQYIDLIAQECKGLDVFGTNVYRGISARDLFQVVKDKLGVPVMFTEFGADAFNAKEMREDQASQARYLIGQWEEIYEQSSGKGRVGNAIGGFVFQWSDGWWKYGQESRLDIHDTHASWPNGGYVEDFVEGEFNMNEEWWGICAKGPADGHGLYDLYPRAAYYALQHAFRLPAYAPGTDLPVIQAHFAAMTPATAALMARGDHASLIATDLARLRVSGLRMRFETINTGGSSITTPKTAAVGAPPPGFLGFDHMQSFYTDFEAHPAANVSGMLSVNVLGRVPQNPINEIFYENRGRPRTVQLPNGQTYDVPGIERVKVYHASVSWEEPWFQLDGFYRTGHYHWGAEGDFFGLYREANYGENIDIYNGEAPIGIEMSGRKSLEGLKVAFGQQLWWGANPAYIFKYRRRVGPVDVTGIYTNDFAAQNKVTSSVAVPVPPTRKATLQMATQQGHFHYEVGGIWSGSTKEGESFQIAEKSGDTYRVLQDYVIASDAFGAKGKVTLQSGRWNWYAQGARMGIVADAGPTAIVTYTGWTLKDCGSGNQTNALTGVAANFGKFQIGPNFLWQKPIIGPVPSDVPSPGRPRNILEDPFAVRANREIVGAELLIGYDPTPATWMWAWDNDVREDASLAASLDLVYRHMPTTMDAAIGILADGTTTFPFPGATPPRDLWEARGRVVSRLNADTRVAGGIYAGTGEPNGDNSRLIHRYGFDGRIARKTMAFATFVKFNDWGPYDYHRDFNNTFPLQVMGDLSHSLGAPRWLGVPQTRIGMRGLWRSLDQYSPRYNPPTILDSGGNPIPDPNAPNGSEWEFRTYLELAM